MKGYKAFNKDLTCRDFQFEIGQTYEMYGEIECCVRGFHFCKYLVDCYRFYDMSTDVRICEVDAIGKIKTDDNIKYCTDKIRILREVKNPREKTNMNKTSTGFFNSGYYNTGNWNSGNYNSGNYNSGNGNTGSYNSGNGNNGGWNTGEWNSGDWNSGDWNNGVFNCSRNPKIKMFDKESNWTMDDWHSSYAYIVMASCPHSYIYYDIEQNKTLVHEVTTEDKQNWWDGLGKAEKNAVKSLPGFDSDKFYLCTGIRV